MAQKMGILEHVARVSAILHTDGWELQLSTKGITAITPRNGRRSVRLEAAREVTGFVKVLEQLVGITFELVSGTNKSTFSFLEKAALTAYLPATAVIPRNKWEETLRGASPS